MRHLSRAISLVARSVADKGDGMGSIVFDEAPGLRKHVVGSCQFTDADGLPVIVDLHVWEDERPAELAFWKVDFSAVKQFPRSEAELTRVRYANAH